MFSIVVDVSNRLTEQQLKVWENFHALGEIVRREVGRDLWDESQLTEADFTVLAELSLQARGSMRASECARSIDWEASRLSHQLRRMEARGLITRGRAGEADGRASKITLTDAGRRAYRSALGPHLESARRWFLDGLDDRQLAGLDDALAALLEHVQRTVTAATIAADDSDTPIAVLEGD